MRIFHKLLLIKPSQKFDVSNLNVLLCLNREGQANATGVIQNQQENHSVARKEPTIHQNKQQIQSEETSTDPNPMEALLQMKNVLGIQLSMQQIAKFFKDYFPNLVDLAIRGENKVKDEEYYKNNYNILYRNLKNLSPSRRNGSLANEENRNESSGREI